MSTGFRAFSVQLFNTRSRAPIDDDTGVCNVLTEGSPVELTIYGDGNGGSTLTNPMTFTNGWIQFWTADTVTAVDLTILTSTSHSIFADSVSESQHRIDIDPDRVLQKLVIPYLIVGASEVIVDTGYDIAANMLMKDIEVDVFAVGTGAVLTVGTSTTTTGFGFVSAATTGIPAALLEEALVSVCAGYGSFFTVLTGPYVRKKHVRANTTSGANIVYSNTTSSSTAGSGYIFLLFDRIVSR